MARQPATSNQEGPASTAKWLWGYFISILQRIISLFHYFAPLPLVIVGEGSSISIRHCCAPSVGSLNLKTGVDRNAPGVWERDLGDTAPLQIGAECEEEWWRIREWCGQIYWHGGQTAWKLKRKSIYYLGKHSWSDVSSSAPSNKIPLSPGLLRWA